MRRRQCAAHSGGRTAELLRRSDATKFLGIRMHRRQCAAHSGVHTAGATTFWGTRMRQGQCAAHSCAPHCGSTTFGIRMATRSPQRRARCRETTFCGIGMRQGNTQPTAATKAMRGPQRHTHCRATTLLDPCLPVMVVSFYGTTFCGTGMRQGNTQPTAARARQRDDILRHSNATKAMRGPQRHTHCRATTLLDPCLPVMVVSFYGVNWLSTLNVIG